MISSFPVIAVYAVELMSIIYSIKSERETITASHFNKRKCFDTWSISEVIFELLIFKI